MNKYTLTCPHCKENKTISASGQCSNCNYDAVSEDGGWKLHDLYAVK